MKSIFNPIYSNLICSLPIKQKTFLIRVNDSILCKRNKPFSNLVQQLLPLNFDNLFKKSASCNHGILLKKRLQKFFFS